MQYLIESPPCISNYFEILLQIDKKKRIYSRFIHKSSGLPNGFYPATIIFVVIFGFEKE